MSEVVLLYRYRSSLSNRIAVYVEKLTSELKISVFRVRPLSKVKYEGGECHGH